MIERINQYLNSVNWAESTKKTAKSKLITFTDLGSNPQLVFERLKALNYSLYTIRQYFIIASSYFEYLGNNEVKVWLSTNSYIFRNSYQDKTKQITDEVIKHILEESLVLNQKLYSAIYLMVNCGLRLAEITLVKKISDTVISTVGKGGKYRELGCSATAIPFNPDGSVEVASSTQIRKYLFNYGITPHDLRAYFATRLYHKQSVGLDTLQLALGHKSIVTTSKYIRKDKELMIESMLKAAI